MEEKSKYAAQQRYNRKNYVRFPLDLKPDVLEEFRRVCAENGTNPTAENQKIHCRILRKRRQTMTAARGGKPPFLLCMEGVTWANNTSSCSFGTD